MPDNKRPIEIIINTPIDPNLTKAIDHLRELGFEPEIQTSKNYLQRLTDILPVAVFYTGPTGLVEHANALCEQVTGYSLSEFINKPWEVIIHPTHLSIFEEYRNNPLEHPHIFSSTANIVNKVGEIVPVFLTIVFHLSEENPGELLGYWGVFFDTNQHDLRNIDQLTNLINRIALTHELEHAIKRANETKHKIFLLRIDIDSFSRINEIYGAAIGDTYLQRITLRLLETVRDHDTVARLGGDEFGILLDDIEGIDFIDTMLVRIQSVFEMPVLIKDITISSSACIGISVYPDLANCAGELLRGAQRALVKAKVIGSGKTQFDDQETRHQMLRSSLIFQQLEHAIKLDELTQVYQPQVDAKTGALSGYEALLRWNHAQLGAVHPSEFIPIAEQMGLIREIDQWSQKAAIRQHAIWLRMFPERMAGIKLSVNLSARRLLDTDLIEWFLDVLQENAIKADQVILELTETALLDRLDSKLKTLHVFREYGFGIALDDFGTGYSSLTILEKIPFSQIKIDQSFITSMFDNPKSEAIVKLLIHLSALIGETVVAEGVETEQQVQWLRENDCQYIQGYYYSKPLATDDMEKYIKKSR